MAAVAVPARAQGIEVSAWGGYVLSDGVSLTNPITAGDGLAYTRVDPKDGGVFGFNFGVGTDFHIGSQDMFLEYRWIAARANRSNSYINPISLGVRYF